MMTSQTYAEFPQIHVSRITVFFTEFTTSATNGADAKIRKTPTYMLGENLWYVIYILFVTLNRKFPVENYTRKIRIMKTFQLY